MIEIGDAHLNGVAECLQSAGVLGFSLLDQSQPFGSQNNDDIISPLLRHVLVRFDLESFVIEWLDTTIAYWHWLVLGFLLFAAEVFVSGFVLFWFGVSAVLLSLLLMAVDMPFTAQLLIWVLLSVATVVGWLKFLAPRWKDRTTAGMAAEALAGQVGSVIESNQGKSRGKLRFPAPLLGEDEWQFLSETEIAIGERVQVVDISGNTLVVRKV